MAATLEAHEYPLSKVFSSDFNFVIPDYQRPYRWGTEQAAQLLDDLVECMERGEDEPYFLGSLVLVQQGAAAYDVIDGQQRLTTLTILLAVLRDLAEDDEFAQDLAKMVLEKGSKINKISAKPRLKLRAQDSPFMRKYVQDPGQIETLVGVSDAVPATESQVAIRNNAAVLRESLIQWDDERRSALGSLLSLNTYLVVVSTPNVDSAYRIFSVMNARGLDLTPADIFKSRVIGAIAEESDHSARWEQAEEALGSDDFTDLFRDIRTIVNGDRARRELLHEFPAQVLDPYIAAGKAAEFVDDLLLPYADAFAHAQGEECGPGDEWAPVNNWLRRLRRIDNKDWRPAALWALKERSDDAAFLAQFFQRLERLAASFLLRQEYTTPRIGRYLELLAQLKAGDGLDAAAFILSDKERQLSREALNGAIYRMQPRRARYVLLRLDELLAKDPGAVYTHSVLSIEHVLPQSPRVGSQWNEDFTEEQRVDLVHRLGNLLLLNRRKNSLAQNYDFAKKKERYFGGKSGSATFALTTQVLNHDTWTPQVIEHRQQALVATLIDEWDLN